MRWRDSFCWSSPLNSHPHQKAHSPRNARCNKTCNRFKEMCVCPFCGISAVIRMKEPMMKNLDPIAMKGSILNQGLKNRPFLQAYFSAIFVLQPDRLPWRCVVLDCSLKEVAHILASSTSHFRRKYIYFYNVISIFCRAVCSGIHHSTNQPWVAGEKTENRMKAERRKKAANGLLLLRCRIIIISPLGKSM